MKWPPLLTGPSGESGEKGKEGRVGGWWNVRGREKKGGNGIGRKKREGKGEGKDITRKGKEMKRWMRRKVKTR